MPGFDATGPQGEGPRTGGQRGRCGPRKEQDDSNTGRGLGRGGRPRGGGRGRCRGGRGRAGWNDAGGRGAGRGRGWQDPETPPEADTPPETDVTDTNKQQYNSKED